MLKGKTILLGVTGSIAAYKIANLASALVKQGAEVHVLMTKNAVNFINPITFETLTGHKCLVDTFDRNFEFSVEHVSLAKTADIFCGPGLCQCNRKAGPRDRRRYADHYLYGLHLSEDRLACHEHADV